MATEWGYIELFNEIENENNIINNNYNYNYFKSSQDKISYLIRINKMTRKERAGLTSIQNELKSANAESIIESLLKARIKVFKVKSVI